MMTDQRAQLEIGKRTADLSVPEARSLILHRVKVEHQLPSHEVALEVWTELTNDEKVELVKRALP